MYGNVGRGTPSKIPGNRPTKDESSISKCNKGMIYYSRYLETLQLCHFTDEQWINLIAILIDHRDGFTDDQWKTVFLLLSENRLNDEQSQIFVDMLDTSTQKLVLLHAGGGTGKTFVTCKIFEEMALRNEICRCMCPTGVGALHLPQGRTSVVFSGHGHQI